MFYFLSLCDYVFIASEYVETACFENGLTAWFDCNTLV